MGLVINKSLVNDETGKTLQDLCPFGAISYQDGVLDISSACKMCKMCVNKGPKGVITLEEETIKEINKDEYRGVCVYVNADNNYIHPVTFELIGKARQLAAVIKHPVYALLIGYQHVVIHDEQYR